MKKIFYDPFVIICVILALYLSSNFISALNEGDPTPILQKAQMNYLTGERTKSVEERQKAFNASLNSFLMLEEKYHPTYGTGKLYYDVGNTFFQLEKYPEALLYYNRAKQLRPRDDKIDSHIVLAQNKLDLPNDKEDKTFDWLFFLHRRFSLPERLQLFSLGLFLSFVLLSIYLWIPRRFIYHTSIVTSIFTLLLFLSLCYTYVFSPVEGILVKSSAIYRDAGENYVKVQPEPLSSGLKVHVLDMTSEGKWLKITTTEGVVGFVSQESLRII